MDKSKNAEIEAKAIEIRRAYYRQYKKSNPDKAREWQRRVWERKAIKAMQEEIPSSPTNEDSVNHKGGEAK